MEYSLDEMKKHLEALNERIAKTCEKVHRDRNSVKLIWVSKFHPISAVQNAIALGATDFGENRVQEAEMKFSSPLNDLNGNLVQCHIIGPIQSNKLKKAAIVANWIHSITSVKALEVLEKTCQNLENEFQIKKQIQILFQINAGEEETKSGLEINEVDGFFENLFNEIKINNNPYPHLCFRGLMSIGKNTGNPEDSRECFSYLRDKLKKIQTYGDTFKSFDQLSMGMTGDLEVAIEEGATMIRIGTALFGERDYSK